MMENSKYVSFDECDKICRTCLSFQDTDLYAIGETECENVKLADILQQYLSLKIEENDGLPQKMCESCIVLMFEAHTFLEKCKSSEFYLRNAYDISKKNPGAIFIKVEDIKAKSAAKERRSRKKQSESQLSSEESARSKRNSCSDAIKENNNKLVVKEEENSVDNEVHHPDLKSDDTSPEIVTKIEINSIEYLEDEESFEETLSVKKIEVTEDVETSDNKEKSNEVVVSGNEEEKVISKREKRHNFCEECFETLDDSKALRLHWRTYDHYPKRLRCPHCNRGFSTGKGLKTHVNIHTLKNIYSCNLCNRQFNIRGNFRRHLLTHEDVRKFKCEKCDKLFTRLEFLRNHERKLHGREKLLCPYCGRAFASHNNFKKHERRHLFFEATNKNEAPAFQCQICGKLLATEATLAKHKQNIHGPKSEPKEYNPLLCTHCGQTFPNKYETRQHRLHSECNKYLEKFPCEECGKVFFAPMAIYKHIRIHNDEKSNKTYQCKICPETFHLAKDLYTHVQKHRKTRKHICSHCGKGFFTKSHLGYHLRLHTGEKPYTCEVCHKSFTVKGTLTGHMALHMADRPSYKCEICGSVYVEKKGLRKHCKSVHNMDITL